MNVVVVGGGPAGMMAAIAAAEGGACVTLAERNEKCGKKLYITGKGRCNVTNTDTGGAFLAKVRRNPRFLHSALAAFDSGAAMALLRESGLELKTERGGRVFPASDKASDVTKALLAAMDKRGVRLRLNTRAVGIDALGDPPRVCGLRAENCYLPCDRLIICTGGLSYPATGSTGDGHRMAGETGHTVTELFPSLTGIVTEQDWPARAQGLTLKNVGLWAGRGKKRLFYEQGELLLTHFGISGPLALTLSSVLSGAGLDGVDIAVDLKPALDEQTLYARVRREFEAAGKKTAKNAMAAFAPQTMAEILLESADIPAGAPAGQTTAQQRLSLVKTLKRLGLTPAGFLQLSEAVVTRGGVSVSDINPGTMESRRVKGLYFAGEIIDVDAQTGGYNIQIAFTTGWRAGVSAAGRD